jgi:hypothetical protein
VLCLPVHREWTADAILGRDLTANPLTSVVPPAGVVKLYPNLRNVPNCSPTEFIIQLSPGQIAAFSTHLQVTGAATYVTETPVMESAIPLATDVEFPFLIQACSFVQYLGSGKGTCTCPSAP